MWFEVNNWGYKLTRKVFTDVTDAPIIFPQTFSGVSPARR